MKIPIIQTLETQQQWLAFSALAVPYVYVNSPLSLVDFQTNYLQITDIKKNLRDGRRAKKFSLGDRRTEQAAWDFIESNNWSLKKILKGLSSLDFSSNVRDNSALNIHSNVTVRESFSRDKCVISPVLLQQLKPLTSPPKQWFLNDFKCLLNYAQFSHLEWFTDRPEFNTVPSVLLQLISYPEGFKLDLADNRITLSYRKMLILALTPSIAGSVVATNLLQAAAY